MLLQTLYAPKDKYLWTSGNNDFHTLILYRVLKLLGFELTKPIKSSKTGKYKFKIKQKKLR